MPDFLTEHVMREPAQYSVVRGSNEQATSPVTTLRPNLDIVLAARAWETGTSCD